MKLQSQIYEKKLGYSLRLKSQIYEKKDWKNSVSFTRELHPFFLWQYYERP